jgi:hypothetical protein
MKYVWITPVVIILAAIAGYLLWTGIPGQTN